MMAELQTNFNVAPFYDDYDEDKQYYRMLFRPSTAVQARELTQLQTMMQKQVSRFGDSIYKDGSVIEGCNFTEYPDLPQIKFTDGNTSTIDFSLIVKNNTDIANSQSHLTNSYLLVSNTSGLRAAVFQAFVGAESVVNQGSSDTNRAYVLYLNSGNNSGQEVKTFNTTQEQIDVYVPFQDKQGPLVASNKSGILYTLSSNSTVNALGVGYGIHVGQGIIYQKGFFLKTLADNFMVREHSANTIGMKVGFNTAEYIVKPAEDDSLYDNSIGSPNQNAPGAYRLKLVPSPIAYDSLDPAVTIPKDFLPIIDYDSADGRPVVVKTNPELSRLGDLIATRTKEESGDYIVKPFQVNVEASANSQTFYYTTSPGIAYIDGYRVEYLSTRRIEVNRAIYSESLKNLRATANFGNYVKIRDVVGTFDIGGNQDIGIYSANQSAISRNPSTTAPLGTLVGNANVRAVTFNTGTKGTGTAEYLLYLSNIRMKAGNSFATSAKSFYVNGTFGKIWADIFQANNKSVVYESASKLLLLDTGFKGLKTLTSNTSNIANNDTSYIYRSTSAATALSRASSSVASAVITLASDQYNYGVGTVGDTIDEDIHVMFAQDTFSNLYPSATLTRPTITTEVAASGTFNSVVYAGGVSRVASAIGVGPAPWITNFGDTNNQNPKAGETIQIIGTGGTTYHSVVSVTAANVIFVTPIVTSATGAAIYKFHKAGSYVNFTGSSNTLSFSGTPVRTLTANLAMNLFPESGTAYTVYAQVPSVRNNAVPILKVVNKNTHIGINCASHYANTVGPWSLGMPDVLKITAVYVGTGFANTNPNRVDWFELDNGQQDNFYGLAQLKLKPVYKTLISSTSRLLVTFNHLTPNITSSQATFFSVDSYPIDDANTANTQAIATAEIPLYTSVTGEIYDLRNYIDLRPVLANTANVFTSSTIPGITINPANNQSVYYSTVGAKLAIEPDSNFSFNAQYYLPRMDALMINKEGALVVKTGAAAFNPRPPTLNNSGMKIADIYVPPYPSLTFQEAE